MRVAGHEQFVSVGTDLDVEQLLEVLEVLVVGTEERFNPFIRDGDSRKGGRGDESVSGLFAIVTTTLWQGSSRRVQVELLELSPGDLRGRASHEIQRVRRLWERDHVPNGWLAREERHDPIEAQRDTTVGGCPVP